MGLFSAIGAGLRKISFSAAIDDEYFDELEEQLILADVGVQTAGQIVAALRERAKKERLTEAAQLRPVIQEVVRELLAAPAQNAETPTEHPRVILMIGVNGVGKTTTIGKLAARFGAEGKTVLLAAADTFRAAAIEQLSIWGKRTGAQVVAHSQGSDPAAVVHDAEPAPDVRAGAKRAVDQTKRRGVAVRFDGARVFVLHTDFAVSDHCQEHCQRKQNVARLKPAYDAGDPELFQKAEAVRPDDRGDMSRQKQPVAAKIRALQKQAQRGFDAL